MSITKLTKRVIELRKRGLSFREIERKFPKSLGAGNGTRALRISRAAA